ncbi:MAG: hypothetical protein AAF337_10025 [Pseudomonadota bacterium]
MRSLCFGLLVLAGIISQVSGFYVKQEAVELRGLVRQVAQDSERLEQLRTREMFVRRPAQIEEWASAFENMGPPQQSQVQGSLKAALLPEPAPRPEIPVRTTPTEPGQDVIAELISQTELSL